MQLNITLYLTAWEFYYILKEIFKAEGQWIVSSESMLFNL